MRIGIAVSLLVLATSAATAQRPYRPDTASLQRLLVAEDSRGKGTDGIAPMMTALHGSDTLLRRVAVRAMGRLQRPVFARLIADQLSDPVPAIRAETANAIAQSEVNIKRRAADSGQGEVQWAAETLQRALETESDRSVADAIAESLGRLPFGDTATAQAAEKAIVHHAGTDAPYGHAHALYWIALNRTSTGGLTPDAVALLRTTARKSADPITRRVATLALVTARALDSAGVSAAMADRDEQVRRTALGAIAALSPEYRVTVVHGALGDASPSVRIAAIAAARAGVRQPDCSAIVTATLDPDLWVEQMAIDALAMPCMDEVDVVLALQRKLFAATAPTGPGNVVIRAHALAALAHIDPERTPQAAANYAKSDQVLLRLYAAKAAAVLRDTAILIRLAGDNDHNVREAAITGLASTSKHAADSIYIAALASPGYQVVREAALALGGSTNPAAVPALFDNLDRLTREKRENSRDPRIAIISRISTLGSRDNSSRLTPYLVDFDSTVADSAAKILSRWSGSAVQPHPAPLPIAIEPLAATYLAEHTDLRVTMVSGSTFTVRMFNTEAPATVARMIKLAKAHYFDGHVFQRVEPNFVVQGGGPDATEYVGDAQFMRDEIALRSHLRGTLGISSRGRDTGDAQWFFNVIDNTRLDHEYTVFGEVVSGEDVVERILEGDVIARVEIVAR